MELSLSEIIVLAVVQGVTEFLPVSSSGHLVIVAALMAGGDVDKFDVGDVNICYGMLAHEAQDMIVPLSWPLISPSAFHWLVK